MPTDDIDSLIDSLDEAYDAGKEDLANKMLELLRQLDEEEDLERDDILDAFEQFLEAELSAKLLHDGDFDDVA